MQRGGVVPVRVSDGFEQNQVRQMAAGVGVGVCDGVDDLDGGTGVRVLVGVPVGVCVDVFVGVWVDVGVGEGDDDGVCVGVGRAVGVFVGVGDTAAAGVLDALIHTVI